MSGDFMAKKDYNLTETTRLLLKMRDNCERKEGELYDDPERAEKRNALNAAIDIINNPSYVAAGDLISRSVLLESMGNVVFKNVPVEHQPYVQAVCDAFEAVAKNVSTVDAEPVRHERWTHLGGDEWCCTGCGEVIHTEGSWERPTKKYCHECGAKMDGDK